MSKVGKSTDGNYYVEMWIEDASGVVSQVPVGASNVVHGLEIRQGSTYTRDVNVKAILPPGIGNLAFLRGGNQEAEWGAELKSCTGQSPYTIRCQIEVLGGVGQIERVQCAELKYADVWHPQYPNAASWVSCHQNIPFDTSIQIV